MKHKLKDDETGLDEWYSGFIVDVSKDSVTIRYYDYSEEFTWPLSEIREDISNKDLYFFKLYLEYISLVVATGMYVYIYIYIYDITKYWLGVHKLDVGMVGQFHPGHIYILVTAKVGYTLPI